MKIFLSLISQNGQFYFDHERMTTAQLTPNILTNVECLPGSHLLDVTVIPLQVNYPHQNQIT